MELDNVIIEPVITEKTQEIEALPGSKKRYCFKVHPGASKELIRQALHKLYDVKVVKVNTMVVGGRFRRYRRDRIQLASWKKAIVTLAPGQELDLKISV
ncbi:MAG: 50S ribosomal protein L23 [Leptospiraceae bacterium]|nr:50S ribosomal protein L23 [Leptospiraceae bacterium]